MYSSGQLANSVLLLLSFVCGHGSFHTWRNNGQLFLHQDTDLLLWVNDSSHPNFEFVDKSMHLFSSLLPQETKSKLPEENEICAVALQNVLLWNDFLLRNVRSVEIHVSDDVTVRVI